MSVNGTLVEDKMRRFKSECVHFSFSKCHIYTHDDASANFSTNSHERDNSVVSDVLAWDGKLYNLILQCKGYSCK